jgi:hypothetical protein
MTVDEERNMDDVLARLCRVLDEELERQENVLAVCHAQYEAARAHKIEPLNAKTTALELLIRDAVRAQNARISLFRRLVDAYGIPPEKQTMSGLIAVTPEPWSARLREFQNRMRNVVDEIKVTVRANAALLRASKRTVDQLLKPLSVMGTQGVYDARGTDAVQGRSSSTLINQFG